MPSRRFIEVVPLVIALARFGEQLFPDMLDLCSTECLRQIDNPPILRDPLETPIGPILWPAPVDVQLEPPVGSAGYAPGIRVEVVSPTLPALLAEGYSQWDATRMMLRYWEGQRAKKHVVKTAL